MVYVVVIIMTFKASILCADYPALFAKLIARTAKDIDVLIESLPSEESSLELQVTILTVTH